MKTNHDFAARSQAAVWHPCTQMKLQEHFPPLPVVRGEGVWLFDAEGKRYLDAVSSWWVNLFGHANPRINDAIKSQLDALPHTLLAGCTHEPVIELSERLGQLTGLGHAFYGSDGASAVEIALKMSFHYWRNGGKGEKRQFISLEKGYHGETLGALGVTDVALFRDAYGALLHQHHLVPPPRFTPNVESPITTRVSGHSTQQDVQSALRALEALLERQHQNIAAFIVEPLVQGATGMRMYHADYLQGAAALCQQFGVHLIADEIMTGFGRTGTMFAHQQARITPDFICLSKGLTAGYLPLSCVLARDSIYEAFYDDDTARGFLHSHSYTGNPLACRAALASLDIFEHDGVIACNEGKAERFNQIALPLAQHERVRHFRNLGMIWAFEVDTSRADFSRACYAAALEKGVLLRPIGNTVYFMPPYIIDDEAFNTLIETTRSVLDTII